MALLGNRIDEGDNLIPDQFRRTSRWANSSAGYRNTFWLGFPWLVRRDLPGANRVVVLTSIPFCLFPTNRNTRPIIGSEWRRR